MSALLTFDIGTTAVKAALFDERLNKLGMVIREYRLLTPESDIVELPAVVYWENIAACVRELLFRTNIDPSIIISITCTTQGETLIPVDENGMALHNAVVWLDARAAEESALLLKLYTKDEFYSVTGIPEINPYCPVAKMMWFKSKRPEIYRRTKKFLLLEDYIIYHLTGRFVSNPSLMCTTGYFDICKNTLWDDVFYKTEMDKDKIPELFESSMVVGQLTKKSAEELGLSVKTVVIAGAMDQAASAFGAGGCTAGFLSETTGTCLAVGVSTETPHFNVWSPVPIYYHVKHGLYFKIVISQTAGIILKWFKDEFCGDMSGVDIYKQMDELAAAVPPLSKGVTLFPYLAGLSAYPNTKGAFFGISLETGRGCLIRAILEGTGYILKESLSLLDAPHSVIHSMGGGAKSTLWNQIKADICQMPIHILEEEESALLGAAMLGGTAVGLFADLNECAGMVRVKRTFEPNQLMEIVYNEGYAKYIKICSLLTEGL